MSDKNTRVTVKFLDSIAGLRDPSPAVLEAKYKHLAESLGKEKEGSKLPKYSKFQIEAAVEAERKRDEAVIRIGFTKDWSFKVGDEALVNVAAAEAMEASGVVAIVKEKKTA